MGPHPHTHWRDGKEWKSLDLEMSSANDEACKMYDAILTQVINHWEDPTLGGTQKCFERMFGADPDILLGHVLKCGLHGELVQHNKQLATDVSHMMDLADKPNVKRREKQHALAVYNLTQGDTKSASNIWEDILVEHPTDMLSLKMLHDMYIVTGVSQGLRDSCAKAIPHWKPNMPHYRKTSKAAQVWEDILVEYPTDMFALLMVYLVYSYNGNSQGIRDCCGMVLPFWKPTTPLYGDLLGMYGFGLNEMNQFDMAEKYATQALEINPYDAWASHCVAHVCEMTGRYKKGIQFMSDTEKYWNDTGLQCHNYWHWALYHYETGDLSTCTGILDNHIMPYLNQHETLFGLTDAASLMFRLQEEGIDVTKYWADCGKISKKHIDSNVFGYYDANSILTFFNTNDQDSQTKFLTSMNKAINDDRMNIGGVYKAVMLPFYTAMEAFSNGDFDLAVETMKPLKYQLQSLGGSHAQRDLFNIFSIHAGLKSTKPENKKYASCLLMERKLTKEETPLANRLLAKLVNTH